MLLIVLIRFIISFNISSAFNTLMIGITMHIAYSAYYYTIFKRCTLHIDVCFHDKSHVRNKLTSRLLFMLPKRQEIAAYHFYRIC